MASSRVMASLSPASSDLGRQPSIHSLTLAELQSSISADPAKTLGSMSIEDLLRNLYGDPTPPAADPTAEISRQGSFTLPKGMAGKTVEEVMREIDGGGDGEEAAEMTLEDFLTRAGAVMDDDYQGVFDTDPAMQQDLPAEISIQLFGNEAESSGGGGGRGGRKRGRMVDPGDRVVMQRQKRMIKNRESAARSRERKQAYTVELESLVMQLEEQNSELLRYEDEQRRMRLKQIMENVIPITQKRKPPRRIGRTYST